MEGMLKAASHTTGLMAHSFFCRFQISSRDCQKGQEESPLVCALRVVQCWVLNLPKNRVIRNGQAAWTWVEKELETAVTRTM